MSGKIGSFWVRTFSGALFVTLLLLAVCWNYVAFTVFFFAVAMLALGEYFRLMRRLNVVPFQLTGYMCAAVLYFVFLDAGDRSSVLYLVFILPLILFGSAVFVNTDEPVRSAVYTLAGLYYCVLPLALLHLLVYKHSAAASWYDPRQLLGVIFLIWGNDTFAYLTGKALGKHKLAEHISPGKTWEGTIGGVLASIGISFLVKMFLDPQHGDYWLLLGITVPVVATIGDLFQSLLKRKAGVKDSGTIMPGHGGVLDRFDSLLFVSPFVVLVLGLLELY